MHKVESTRLDLAREFRERPFGPHSPDLQKLLKILRWDRVDERVIAVQPRRGGPWRPARATGPKGSPIELFEGEYATPAEAAWGIFRSRWERHTGMPLVLSGEDGERRPAGREAGRGSPVSGIVRYPILGYSDRFSVENGSAIAFKVSAETEYETTILRLRCGDQAGVGFKAAPVDAAVNGPYPGRVQETACGSFVEIADAGPFGLDSFTLLAHVWPTTPALGRRQALLGGWTEDAGRGYVLGIDEQGRLSLRLGDGNGRSAELSIGRPLLERHWYLVAASFDAETGAIWIGQRALRRYGAPGDTTAEAASRTDVRAGRPDGFRIAAWTDRARAGAFYNGKIDGPRVASRALTPAERQALLSEASVPDFGGALVAAWDFGREIPSTRIVDIGPHGRHGETRNLPTRGMKGWNWDGSEYNWTHKPEHYGAIHFHDDDLYDCGWDTDFTFEVPADLPSGLYCAHLKAGEDEDYVPFVVRPPRGTARADLALLLPTASYWAYANTHHHLERREGENIRGVFTTIDATTLFLHEHPEYGCSLYDRHSDGSGVCYSSRLRPVLTIRPKERLWQLPADTHIIDWLEAQGIAFDVITEDDLDAEGEALLAPYRCVMTGTHPEYPSKRMMDAFAAFQERGGRFIYMGGNGFYWRTSYHPELPGVIETRRAEDGIRTWLAEGGEYYHSFTGELGGMWRRMGRPPQSVAGTGMTAQGFDASTHFVRMPASFDARAAFVFEGVGADEPIGNFGLVGGGAAGWEIDRADAGLGTPPHALVLATADDFSAAYHWMKEELTHTHSAITGETCPHVRCDMVFYETPNGGAVFATSSIAWSGALSHNGYDNNVSRITGNVVRRFLDPRPF